MDNNNYMDIEETFYSKVNDYKIIYDGERNPCLSDFGYLTKNQKNLVLANEIEKFYSKTNEESSNDLSLKHENYSNNYMINNSENRNIKEIFINENHKIEAFFDYSEIKRSNGPLCQDEPLKEKLMDNINNNYTKNISKPINNDQFKNNFCATKYSSIVEEEEEENQGNNSHTNSSKISQLYSPETNYDNESSTFKTKKTKKRNSKIIRNENKNEKEEEDTK